MLHNLETLGVRHGSRRRDLVTGTGLDRAIESGMKGINDPCQSSELPESALQAVKRWCCGAVTLEPRKDACSMRRRYAETRPDETVERRPDYSIV